jgi:hypothetical protein
MSVNFEPGSTVYISDENYILVGRLVGLVESAFTI